MSLTGRSEIDYLGQPRPGIVPQVFAPGLVSVPQRGESSVAFTRDGRECYFSATSTATKTRQILVVRHVDGRWSAPVPTSFSDGQSSGAALADNDQTLYFIRRKYTIWRVRRVPEGAASDGWSAPELVPAPINFNPAANENVSCAISSLGHLWLCSWRAGGLGQCDIWRARLGDGQFNAPEPQRELNSPNSDCTAVPGPDESYVVLRSNRPGGLGEGDLYVSFADGHGGWAAPVNAGPAINTADWEDSPTISPDGKFLFFSRTVAGEQDIYWVSTDAILKLANRTPLPPVRHNDDRTRTAPSIPALPESRVGGAVVEQNGTIYYLSGVRMVQGRFAGNVPSILRLDPDAASWVVEGEVPARSGFAAAIVGSEIFFGGGADDRDQTSDRHFAWNVRTRQLRETARLPAPWYQHGCAAVDGNIYVIGGGPRNHSLHAASRTVWRYSPATDTWERKADMLAPMRNLAVVAHRGRLYAIGGHRLGTGNPGNIAQEYDPVTDRWRRLDDMPTPRTDIAAVVYGERIYVLGGFPSLAVVESLDLERGSWRTEPSLPHGRFAPAAIARGSTLIVLGGQPNETVAYQPAID